MGTSPTLCSFGEGDFDFFEGTVTVAFPLLLLLATDTGGAFDFGGFGGFWEEEEREEDDANATGVLRATTIALS